MKHDNTLDKIKETEQFQQFAEAVNKTYPGNGAAASAVVGIALTHAEKSQGVEPTLVTAIKCAETRADALRMAGAAWDSVHGKPSNVDPEISAAVQEILPILMQEYPVSKSQRRYAIQMLARHAQVPAYSWMVVVLVCEPPDEDTGEPGAVIWSSAPLPEYGVGSIWEDPDHAERWAEIAPIVSARLREYHECDPLPLEEIQKTLDAARPRVYRTTNGSANTWLHYTDPDTDRPHSARVSMRRVRSADQSTHQGDQDHAKYQTYDYD